MPTLEGATPFSPPRQPPNAANVARPQHHTPSPRAATLLRYPERATPKRNAPLEHRCAREDERDDGIPRMVFSPRAVLPGHQRVPTNHPSRQPPNAPAPAPISYIAWTSKGEAGSNWRQHFRVNSMRRSGTLSTSAAHSMAFSNL